MIKGIKKDFWDKVNNVIYINIPKLESRETELNVLKFYSSKKKTKELSICLGIVVSILTFSIINTSEHRLAKLIVMFPFAIGLLYFYFFDYNKKNPSSVFELSSIGLDYKGKTIIWEEIHNMYIKIIPGDGCDNSDLIIERKHKKAIIIPINWLEKNEHQISKIIGKYYWNWYHSK